MYSDKGLSVKSHIYNMLRLSAALLTVLLLILVQYLPEREESILKNPDFDSDLYSETASQGKASIEWLDLHSGKWRCQHQPYKHISCGQTVTLKEEVGLGIDLSGFKGLRLKMWYEGSGNRFRVFIRNFEEGISVEGDYSSTKFMSLLIKTRELNDGTLDIEFNEFSTAEWWAAQWDVSREAARVSFDMMQSMGIDFIDPGDHVMQIVDIVIVGDWIKPDVLYFAVLIIWLVIIVTEGMVRIYNLYRRSVRSEETIFALVNNNVKLTQAQLSLKERVGRDPLTGALNRDGLQQYLDRLRAEHGSIPLGILLLDIDHFKSINDNYGHATGDEVLKQLVILIINNSRANDCFARWGGEEFVLVCPDVLNDQIFIIADKLRRLVEHFDFCDRDQFNITVSIGAAIGPSHNIDALIKEADRRLYIAKENGRNQVNFVDPQT